MRSVGVKFQLPVNGTLSLQDAATHLGFKIETVVAWLRCGLLPGADTGSWTTAALDEAIDRLQRIGIHIDPKKKLAKQIPNIQRQPRTNTIGLKKHHHYLRGVPGALPERPGEPAFMAALIRKHRQFAVQQHANQSPSPAQPSDQSAAEKFTNQPAAIAANQWLTEPHPSPALAPVIPKSVTRRDADRPRQPSTAATVEAPPASSPRPAPITLYTEQEVAEIFRTTLRSFREQTHRYDFHLSFSPATLNRWRRHNLIPPPTNGGWAKQQLDETIAQVVRDGVQNDNPSRRNSFFRKIPNTHRVWKKLEQGDGVGHWLFYFRPTGEPLPGPWGSPAMMTALIACERRRAAQLPEKPVDTPTERPTSSSQSKPLNRPSLRLFPSKIRDVKNDSTFARRRCGCVASGQITALPAS